MAKYSRVFKDGYSYFLTVVTENREPILIDNIEILRKSFALSIKKYRYKLDAVVIMPEHFHMIITPKSAEDYPKIVSHIKRAFTYGLDSSIKDRAKESLSASKEKRKYSGVWQKRFFEHTIRNKEDFKLRFDYIHFNPVKHGLVKKVSDWEYSSFHKYVKIGWYHQDWGDFDESIDFE